MAYPPFILASTAAALGYEVQIFFTFYGLQLLRKDLSDVKISPLGNPAMPMPVPMPIFVQMLPGMESMATMMMKQKMKSKGVASLEELRDLCLEAEVKFIACQMTVDLFEFEKSDFIDGVEWGGAAMFMGFAGDTDVCLFV
jgi:peroxiredoxin family protein